MDDEKILDLFFARSELAITALGEKYGPLCTRLADNILGDRRDAEECVSDAYLAVWNAVPPQRPDRLAAWLCRIVRNLALKRRQEKTALKRNSRYDVALDEIADCFPAADAVTETLDAKETAAAIDRFLNSQDTVSRVLFVRRYWYGDDLGELAAAVRLTKHAVSVRLNRLRAALKRHLEKEGVIL